jgi:hypothetical protein
VGDAEEGQGTGTKQKTNKEERIKTKYKGALFYVFKELLYKYSYTGLKVEIGLEL